jgi:hypothetical protein
MVAEIFRQRPIAVGIRHFEDRRPNAEGRNGDHEKPDGECARERNDPGDVRHLLSVARFAETELDGLGDPWRKSLTVVRQVARRRGPGGGADSVEADVATVRAVTRRCDD